MVAERVIDVEIRKQPARVAGLQRNLVRMFALIDPRAANTRATPPPLECW
ncbi:MAG: hypothetical protein JWP63_3622 [Candidatus Solibacter sp.]|nr:hypothetical protein [Candidatus Solibacter sp.]